MLATQAPAESPLTLVLDGSGWDERRRAAVADGAPLSADDVQDLLALADRLARFEDALQSEAQAPTGGGPAGFVPQVLSGVVTTVASEGDTPAWAECVLETDGQTLRVIAGAVPAAWRAPGVLPQPARLLALRLSESRVLAIAWQWRPTQPHYPQVNFGETVLGGLGVNVAALDRFRDGGPLRAIESEPFYQTLAAMREVGAHQLARFARGNLSRYAQPWRSRTPSALRTEVMDSIQEGRYPIAPLFNDAVTQRGELYLLEGVARRCVAIESGPTADPKRSMAARHGVQRYYELELFTEDSQNLPLVFCLLELPEGFPVGDNLSVPVRVAGFSLKRWAYRTRRSAGASAEKLAPLLVGRAPILLAPARTDARWVGLVMGGAFAGAVALVSWTVWLTARRDAQRYRHARPRVTPSDAAAGLDALAARADATPPNRD